MRCSRRRSRRRTRRGEALRIPGAAPFGLAPGHSPAPWRARRIAEKRIASLTLLAPYPGAQAERTQQSGGSLNTIYEIDCPEKVACPSDWNVAIFPLGPQRGIAPHTSFVAENTYVELEYEQYYAMVPHIVMDWPVKGDLFFAAGRWIIDCGHTPYRTELHPIFMFAKVVRQLMTTQENPSLF